MKNAILITVGMFMLIQLYTTVFMVEAVQYQFGTNTMIIEND